MSLAQENLGTLINIITVSHHTSRLPGDKILKMLPHSFYAFFFINPFEADLVISLI